MLIKTLDIKVSFQVTFKGHMIWTNEVLLTMLSGARRYPRRDRVQPVNDGVPGQREPALGDDAAPLRRRDVDLRPRGPRQPTPQVGRPANQSRIFALQNPSTDGRVHVS